MILISSNERMISLKEEIDASSVITVSKEVFGNGEFIYDFGEEIPYNEEIVVLWDKISTDIACKSMEILMLLNFIKRYSPTALHLFLPQVPFSRQDRTFGKMQSPTLSIFAEMLHRAGVTSLITFDLHSATSESAFKFPVYNLTLLPYLYHLSRQNTSETSKFVILDMGSFKRNINMAKYVNADVVYMHKHRVDGAVDMSNIKGDVYNENIIIMEDLIDSGQTIFNAAKELTKEGSESISVLVTHSNKATVKKLLSTHEVDEVITSDNYDEVSTCGRFRQISYLPVLSVALKSIIIERKIPFIFMEDSWFLYLKENEYTDNYTSIST